MLVFCSAPWADVADDVGDGAAPHIALSGTGASRRTRLWPSGASSSSPFARFAIRVPRLDGAFTGTGDLLAALLFAHASRSPSGLVRAVEAAVASTFSVCERTARARARGGGRLSGVVAAAAAAAGADAEAAAKAGISASAELKLIESKSAIERPVLRGDMQAFAL